MEFDANGYLKPYGPIPADLTILEEVFVKAFPQSAARQPIFEQYQKYNQQLRELAPDGFMQWIDGSFVTQKINPNDIDLVTFVDYKVYEQNVSEFDRLGKWRLDPKDKVDGYLVKAYPDGHPFYPRSEYDKVYWRHTFGTGRNRQRKSFNKGFIELIIV